MVAAEGGIYFVLEMQAVNPCIFMLKVSPARPGASGLIERKRTACRYPARRKKISVLFLSIKTEKSE